MHRSLRRAAAVALAGLAFVASDAGVAQDVIAHNEGPPNIDIDAFYAAVPEMRRMAKETLAQSRAIGDAMERLAAAEASPSDKRTELVRLRDLLVRYRAEKEKLVRLVDRPLRTPAAKEGDLEILRRLRDTELVEVRWDKRKYIDCLRDIAEAVKIRIVMHPDVLKFNTVEVRVPRMPADSLLGSLCNLADCSYYVHDGEVIVIKTIKRNDKRMEKFLREHPDWKFWRVKEAKPVEDDL